MGRYGTRQKDAVKSRPQRHCTAWPYLKAWQRSHDLCLAVYRSTTSWPSEERFGLCSQARRAAHSAAANIAEGCAKKGSAEFVRALLYAPPGERAGYRFGGGVGQIGSAASESRRHDMAALQILTREEIHDSEFRVTSGHSPTAFPTFPVFPVLPVLPVLLTIHLAHPELRQCGAKRRIGRQLHRPLQRPQHLVLLSPSAVGVGKLGKGK
jgi:hypothetical protein